jgi:predicted nuclease with RNAse H fold
MPSFGAAVRYHRTNGHHHDVRVLGIDLAAEAKATGAVLIARGPSAWRASEVPGRLDDDALVDVVRTVDVVGVDSPLGWPAAFVDAVEAHGSFRLWPGGVDRSTLTHRDTDRAIRLHGIRAALSVSADKLGSVAMRCALLQRRWAEEVWGTPAARDGSERLVETYPAAALASWRIECLGYKDRRDPTAASVMRRRIVAELDRALASWLDVQPVREACVQSDHVLDALLSALVAIAAKTSSTHPPADHQRNAALREGWIHVPSRSLSALRPTECPQPRG